MTSDLDATTYKIEELLQDETDRLLLSRYLLPEVKLPPSIDTESVDDDENEDETISETEETLDSNSPREQPVVSAWRKHSLLVVGEEQSESDREGEDTERVQPPERSIPTAVGGTRVSRRRS